MCKILGACLNSPEIRNRARGEISNVVTQVQPKVSVSSQKVGSILQMSVQERKIGIVMQCNNVDLESRFWICVYYASLCDNEVVVQAINNNKK